jgi:hypothetical protein
MRRGVLEDFDALGDQRGIKLVEMLDLIFRIRKEREQVVSQQIALCTTFFQKI